MPLATLRIPPTKFAQFPFAVAVVVDVIVLVVVVVVVVVIIIVVVVAGDIVCRWSDLEIQFSHLMPSADGWRRFVQLNSCV